MNAAASPSLRERLAALIGADAVRDDAETLAEYGHDKWFASTPPDVAVFPATTEMVSAIMRFASAEGIPVTPRGAGFGYVGGCVPVRRGIALSLARMNRIREIHPADGVAVVEPGVITGVLQEAARARGLFYPPDPASLHDCSLGGNIATNAGGPRCLKYGVTRNYVLGLEVVLASGEVLRTGSRTHKNKTGFDLVGLFVGSEGLLGIVTEATLRLLPLPPARAVLSASFPALQQASDAVQRILAAGFLPAALEVADAFTLNAARRHLGQAIVPQGEGHLLVEIDGQEASVRGEAAAIAAMLRSTGALHLLEAYGDEEAEKLWTLRRKFSESLKSTGLTKLNEDIVVPRSRLVDLAEFAAGLRERYGFPVACFGHAGDGNIHTNIMAANYDRPEVREKVGQALDELFAQVLAWGGVITGEHGVGLAKKRWWPQATSTVSRGVHGAIKQALDPQGILNPGKFVEAEPAPPPPLD
ncbi:MAG TPA: FAD-linked oxidase C-terminal domain-containing protein [Chthoniobacteraceae bacterium]|nr:FAD-linked oxidase C-terminal domain-containing protein [Chthoniobacteraceae bacterium]